MRKLFSAIGGAGLLFALWAAVAVSNASAEEAKTKEAARIPLHVLLDIRQVILCDKAEELREIIDARRTSGTAGALAVLVRLIREASDVRPNEPKCAIGAVVDVIALEVVVHETFKVKEGELVFFLVRCRFLNSPRNYHILFALPPLAGASEYTEF